MILDLILDDLDTYMAEFGEIQISCTKIKIYVGGGLGVPEEIRPFFRHKYIYDPWKRVKYSDWLINEEGLFQARVENSGNEWVVYDDKTTGRELPKYEYVGGCWFVFEGVEYWKYSVEKEGSDSILMSSSDPARDGGGQTGAEDPYTLHGAITESPGPGWVSWVIFAKKFYVEI